MIEKAENIINGLENLLSTKMEDFVLKAADGQAELMAELNREQMNQGIRSDGTAISPPYAASTIAAKKRKGQPYDRVTLRDKGTFQYEIKVKNLFKVKILQSADWKTPDLVEKYGDEIHGLTDDNIEKVSAALLPSVIEQTRNYLKL